MSIDTATHHFGSAPLLRRTYHESPVAALQRFITAQSAPARQVWALAWPAIAHMLLVTLVFLAGRAMLGHSSSTALASMQVSGSLAWIIYSVFSATSTGTLAVVARNVGAGDVTAAAKAARASLLLAVAVGAAVVAPILIANGALLRVLFPKADPAVLNEASAYLQIVLPVMPLAFVEAVAAAALQGAGDTRTPLYVAALGNLVNIGLSAALIFGCFGLPEFGVRGAAVGAASTMAIEGILLSAVLFSRWSPLPIRCVSLSGSAAELWRVLCVSGPAFAERLLYNAGYMGFVAIIALLGATAMAGNQALSSVEAVCFLSADGFGVAAGAIMAQKLGAGRPIEAARGGLLAAGMATALLGCFGVLFAVAPRALLQAFTTDAAILEVAAPSLVVAAVAQPFMAFGMVMGTGLRGAGDTKTVLVITAISALGVRLVATWFFAITLGWGLMGVWLGSTADWIIRSVLLAMAYARGEWKTIVV